jgi:hypothetical protein
MAFTNDVVQRVWEKARAVPGQDSSRWRQDECGAWIGRVEYGNRNSQYGWEIDHIKPVSEGGTDDIGNLRPLQWENNASKQAGRLVCVRKASGTANVAV